MILTRQRVLRPQRDKALRYGNSIANTHIWIFIAGHIVIAILNIVIVHHSFSSYRAALVATPLFICCRKKAFAFGSTLLRYFSRDATGHNGFPRSTITLLPFSWVWNFCLHALLSLLTCRFVLYSEAGEKNGRKKNHSLLKYVQQLLSLRFHGFH